MLENTARAPQVARKPCELVAVHPVHDAPHRRAREVLRRGHQEVLADDAGALAPARTAAAVPPVGPRLMTTLIRHMRAEGLRYGLQTMCERGGQANATILELL
jgi:hypothetical protein